MSNTVINDIENDAEQIDAIVQKELSDIGVNSANFNGHKLLKKSGEKIPYTPEHIEEYKKCAENPIYFAENYVYIVNIERGREKIELYKYQKEMIENFAENRFNVVLSSRQSGKCQIYDSIITVRNKKFNNGTPFSIKIGDFYSWIAFRQGFSLAGLFNFENELS